ncbi:MAG: glycosyltransferase family 4 protein [Proteobacteria bacterium]|nr:glycosyltransferase family 4 protein [Pseudomonadota bacterium]
MKVNTQLFFDLSAAQPLDGGNHGGGEYAASVFRRLVEMGNGPHLVLLVDERRPVPDELRPYIVRSDAKVIEFTSKSDFQSILHSNTAHHYFSAMPYHQHDLDFRGLDVVLSIHGLRAIEMPTDSLEIRYAGTAAAALKWLGKQSFTALYRAIHIKKISQLVSINANSLTIVVPSQHTKTILVGSVPIPDSVSIKVLYSPTTAVASDNDYDAQYLTRVGLKEKRYFLIVSGKRWIKNALRALYAVQDLTSELEELQNIDVVVTGGSPKWLPKRILKRTKVLPFVKQSELRALYTNAFALIYPSLNEGFGYPPLEAMTCGTPVISSDVCSIPEIAGDAPMYFSPYSQEELKACIKELVMNEKKWEKHKNLGLIRSKNVRDKQENDLQELCRLIIPDSA